jgi:hypothetical protein
MGTYSRNVSITDQVLILDGLTGTGKTMFGPILGCLNGVQPGRFEYMVEYLSIVAESGHLGPDAAKSLIRTLIDVKTYDNSISREVNFRPKDLSSVLKHGDRVKIFIQLMQNDGTTAIKQHTGRKFSKRINKVLTKQHVPRESVLAGPNLNIYRRYGFDPKSSLVSDRNSYLTLENRILPLLSDSVKKRFKGVADAYEARFGLWF